MQPTALHRQLARCRRRLLSSPQRCPCLLTGTAPWQQAPRPCAPTGSRGHCLDTAPATRLLNKEGCGQGRLRGRNAKRKVHSCMGRMRQLARGTALHSEVRGRHTCGHPVHASANGIPGICPASLVAALAGTTLSSVPVICGRARMDKSSGDLVQRGVMRHCSEPATGWNRLHRDGTAHARLLGVLPNN